MVSGSRHHPRGGSSGLARGPDLDLRVMAKVLHPVGALATAGEHIDSASMYSEPDLYLV
jgi:hypothetical protein